MIDSLGDIGTALAEGKPTALNRLHRELNVSAVYLPQERAVDVTARTRVDSARVRGGNRTRERSTPAQCGCSYT